MTKCKQKHFFCWFKFFLSNFVTYVNLQYVFRFWKRITLLFLFSGGGSPLYPKILQYYTMILQHPRIIIRVQWFSTFFDFIIWPPFINKIYLFWDHKKKISSAHHWGDARQSFHFQKIPGTLKMNIFFWKFAVFFLIHQRTIAKNKI